MAVQTFPVGSLSYWTVPDGITVLRYRLAGGGGAAVPGSDLNAGQTQDPGKGAVVEGNLPVTPGEQLWVAVGPAGASSTVENGAGVGRGGARGGGAATLLGRGAVSLANAVLVAGAGGGGGQDGTGGNGGGIGGRGSGTTGYGLGGGQDPNYTSDVGESASVDSTGGGGGGLVGGRAGTLSQDRRGGGGGGSSRVPSGASVTSTNTGAGSASLTYGLAPLAATNLTPSGSALGTGRDTELAYQFNGVAGAEDVQTSAVISYTTPAGSGTIALTGRTTKGTIPAALTTVAGTVTWSVVTRGQGGAESPSASTTFTLAPAPATPVLANPGTATGPQQTVSWTASGQAAYRLRVSNGDASATYSDVTVADPAARSATVTYPSDGLYTLRLSIRGANGVWSEEDAETVPVLWTPPAAPSVVVTPDPTRGAFALAVTHPAVAGRPAVTSTEYTAAVVDDGPRYGQVERIRVEVDDDGVTRWRGPASETQYAIAVTDRDALGVPATGTTDAPARGYGRSAYGAAPFGR